MKIEGSFVNKMGSTITVSIVIAGSTSADISIEPGQTSSMQQRML